MQHSWVVLGTVCPLAMAVFGAGCGNTPGGPVGSGRSVSQTATYSDEAYFAAGMPRMCGRVDSSTFKIDKL